MSTNSGLQQFFRTGYARYFGTETGGVDILRSLRQLPIEQLESFRATIAQRDERSRLFFMGNGGSFDNARLMAQLCRRQGIAATTPGEADDYFQTTAEKEYAAIYVEGLKQDRMDSSDILIGISGSGNSPNIVNALQYATDNGAAIFCMGGRDGGKMRGICSDTHSMIGTNNCMEAIEDLHCFMMLVVLRSLKTDTSIADALTAMVTAQEAFNCENNIDALTKLGVGMMNTIITNSRTLVLGLGIGANHFRADMGRGATNTIPVRGLATPECFSMNSAQATANDDGSDFIIADGLVKHLPHTQDYGLLCNIEGQVEVYNHCRQILEASNTPFSVIGSDDINISMFADYDLDFAIAMIGHSCGEVIRAYLQSQFAVRVIDVDANIPTGQRKLGQQETHALEDKLRADATISTNEVITFCYGQIFAVTPPANNVLDRCYY